MNLQTKMSPKGAIVVRDRASPEPAAFSTHQDSVCGLACGVSVIENTCLDVTKQTDFGSCHPHRQRSIGCFRRPAGQQWLLCKNWSFKQLLKTLQWKKRLGCTKQQRTITKSAQWAQGAWRFETPDTKAPTVWNDFEMQMKEDVFMRKTQKQTKRCQTTEDRG